MAISKSQGVDPRPEHPRNSRPNQTAHWIGDSPNVRSNRRTISSKNLTQRSITKNFPAGWRASAAPPIRGSIIHVTRVSQLFHADAREKTDRHGTPPSIITDLVPSEKPAATRTGSLCGTHDPAFFDVELRRRKSGMGDGIQRKHLKTLRRPRTKT